MDILEGWRTVVSVLAVLSAAVNLTVAVQSTRHPRVPARNLLAAYALAAAATNAVSIYFRLNDERTNVHWNVGDFTILVPTVGFLVAGGLTLRWLAHLLLPLDGIPTDD
jgi:hypothetical protein